VREKRKLRPLSKPFVLDILEALVRLGGSGTIVQICVVSGYEISTLHQASMKLRRLGLTELAHRGKDGHVFIITESAKIALAIEMGRQTKARATRLLNSRATAAPPSPPPPTQLSSAEHAEAWLSRHVPPSTTSTVLAGF
jgi:hypothetical protein